MRASEESTEQRLDRWQKLRDHLHDYGLHKVCAGRLVQVRLNPRVFGRPVG